MGSLKAYSTSAVVNVLALVCLRYCNAAGSFGLFIVGCLFLLMTFCCNVAAANRIQHFPASLGIKYLILTYFLLEILVGGVFGATFGIDSVPSQLVTRCSQLMLFVVLLRVGAVLQQENLKRFAHLGILLTLISAVTVFFAGDDIQVFVFAALLCVRLAGTLTSVAAIAEGLEEDAFA